jgi:hypothetical protein
MEGPQNNESYIEKFIKLEDFNQNRNFSESINFKNEFNDEQPKKEITENNASIR